MDKSKNPLAYVKHIVKDPINTIAEADARKKEIMPLLLGSAGFLALSVVLQTLLELDFIAIFSLIGLAATALCLFLLFVIKKAKDRFKALTCNQCNVMAEIKTPEDFAKYVSYVVRKNVATYDGVSNSSSNNGVVPEVTASASAIAQVEIELKCPECGAVKKLHYPIVPFRCSAKESKVPVSNVALVKMRLESAVKSAVAAYNDPDQRATIGYSIHSKYNPKYEQRSKATLGIDTVAYPLYNGAKIDYHKDVDEMVEAFFLENQLDGKIVEIK